jgi:glycosyltransferase AglI
MKQEKSLFASVVVCVYNGAEILSSCLSSLSKQTYPHDRYEVIIIDDESTNNTYDIVETFINSRKNETLKMRLTSIQHGGLSVARNAGIQQSNGEIIAFIDQDAIPSSNWLEELIKPFLIGADYIGGRINLLNTESWVARFLQRTRYRQFFGPRIFNSEFVGCNMAFKRKVFDAMGGFHENFIAYGDESALQARISKIYRYAPAPEATVHHEQPGTISAAICITWKSATLAKLVAKASGQKSNWKFVFLFIEQFLITSLPLLIFIYFLKPSILLIPLIVAFIAFIRRAYIRPLNRAIAVGLLQEYGFISGTIGHVLFCLIYNIIDFMGKLISPWIYRKVQIVPPMTTELIVVKTIGSGTKNLIKV